MPDAQIVAGGTSYTRPENRAFYPALDGIRAIAFLLVFFQHYRKLPWGWTGVDLFFVLSGFLITGILWDTRDDPARVRNFYVRRTLRIFPLYYGSMLLLLLFQPIMHWSWNWRWLVWPAYLGNFARFVHSYELLSPTQQLADFQIHGESRSHHLTLYLGHFWSLCVEEQFYLIWPWIVFYIRSRRMLLCICGGSVIVCLLMRLAGAALLPAWMVENEVLYRSTPFRLDALLLGGFLALMMRGPWKEQMFRAVRVLGPAAFLVVAGWMFLSPLGQQHYSNASWHFTWGLTVIDVLFACLLVLAIQPGTLVYRAFKVRPLRWMGRISYGAYVLHDILHGVYNRICQGFVHQYQVVQALALVSTFALAALSYRFFETPFLALKERWTVRSYSARGL